MKKSIILIDGSNFYFKLKKFGLQDLTKCNLTEFCKHVAGDTEIVQCTYYVGAIKTDGTKKTQRMFNKQRQLLAHLKKNNVSYSLGYLLKSDEKLHEKGVDVNMAVDILVGAYENLCDRIIIISSDTDLIPAIKKARTKNKEVEYVGFSFQPSLALIANCTESTLLKKEDLVKFYN